MFKKRLFGFSVKQADALIKKAEQDFYSEAEILKLSIIKLKDDCQLLKSEIEEDKTKLEKAKEGRSVLMKALIHTLIHKN